MDPFQLFKAKVATNFVGLSKLNTLFYKAVDRDKIWELYLDGFATPELRTEHSCNSCKSFLRQYSGIVGIKDGNLMTLWDNIDIPEYQGSLTNIKNYLNTLVITDVFVNDFPKCGVDKSRFDGGWWNHLFIELPSKFVVRSSIDTYRAEKRTKAQMLTRALNELTLDATDTILELVAQDSIYRGSDYKNLLVEFRKLQKEYETVSDKDLYCWSKSQEVSGGVTGIRNTAMGTLLIDLSEGVALDNAVRKFENVVAPNNYKRPTALITEKMINDAKTKLTELGLEGSLDRRYASAADLNVENILFTSTKSKVSDVFDVLKQEATVSVKTLEKVEEITIENFIRNVLPSATSIKLLVENSHLNNFISLLTTQNASAPNLLKWDNNFSWAYTGGVTDSIKENVAKAGGNVTGVLRASLQWNEDGTNIVDYDLHAIEPNRTEISYNNYRGSSKTAMTGNLDVDMINPPKVGIENITWQEKRRMHDGVYEIFVHNYSGHTATGGFSVQIEFEGESHVFEVTQGLKGRAKQVIAKITLKQGVFSIQSALPSNNSVISKDKWGVKTNTWVPVNTIMLSPNFWNEEQGNKHYMFFLDDCKSDEPIRGFFNEFIRSELDTHRKVFEVLGSKLVVPESDNQLSGLGFSSTIRKHVYLQVQGKFKRNLKVTF